MEEHKYYDERSDLRRVFISRTLATRIPRNLRYSFHCLSFLFSSSLLLFLSNASISSKILRSRSLTFGIRNKGRTRSHVQKTRLQRTIEMTQKSCCHEISIRFFCVPFSKSTWHLFFSKKKKKTSNYCLRYDEHILVVSFAHENL